MISPRTLRSIVCVVCCGAWLAACSPESSTPATSPASADAAVADSSSSSSLPSPDMQLQAQVEQALVNASDLPGDFSVAVSEGVVSISGSMACEDCGGMRTPGNVGTVQQSLGAVVRAVPGVERVDFSLDYGN